MNQNLIEAMTSIERARALLFAYEKVFLDLDVEPESRERADMAVSTFYAIWEAVDRAAKQQGAGDFPALFVAPPQRNRTK